MDLLQGDEHMLKLNKEIEELNEILSGISYTEKARVIEILELVYKDGYSDGKYHSTGPVINLYGDRRDG